MTSRGISASRADQNKGSVKRMRFRLALAVALVWTAGTIHAQIPEESASRSLGSSDFTVGDIRIEGLQRIAEGTVLNYLPVAISERLTRQKVDEALRALYQTGFFRDVELRRDGNTLVVAVRERPSIESFELKGNKDIKTEDLTKSLRNVGLA